LLYASPVVRHARQRRTAHNFDDALVIAIVLVIAIEWSAAIGAITAAASPKWQSQLRRCEQISSVRNIASTATATTAIGEAQAREGHPF
jgi:hypothetical protein